MNNLQEMTKDRYTNEDRNCPHCGGSISGHCPGDRIIYWCDVCGSNSPSIPPNINLLTPEGIND